MAPAFTSIRRSFVQMLCNIAMADANTTSLIEACSATYPTARMQRVRYSFTLQLLGIWHGRWGVRHYSQLCRRDKSYRLLKKEIKFPPARVGSTQNCNFLLNTSDKIFGTFTVEWRLPPKLSAFCCWKQHYFTRESTISSTVENKFDNNFKGREKVIAPLPSSPWLQHWLLSVQWASSFTVSKWSCFSLFLYPVVMF